MKERTFTMELSPLGRASRVFMDGDDISDLLRGVAVRTTVDSATIVELQPRHGLRATVTARLPEANISITDEAIARETCVRLAPWLEHKSTCARLVAAEICDCGLNEALRELKA